MMRIARIPAFVWLAAVMLTGPAALVRAAEGPAIRDRTRPADSLQAPRDRAPAAPRSAAATRDGASGCQPRRIIGTGAGFCMIN
jgi:hypothetical protein